MGPPDLNGMTVALACRDPLRIEPSETLHRVRAQLNVTTRFQPSIGKGQRRTKIVIRPPNRRKNSALIHRCTQVGINEHMRMRQRCHRSDAEAESQQKRDMPPEKAKGPMRSNPDIGKGERGIAALKQLR